MAKFTKKPVVRYENAGSRFGAGPAGRFALLEHQDRDSPLERIESGRAPRDTGADYDHIDPVVPSQLVGDDCHRR